VACVHARIIQAGRGGWWLVLGCGFAVAGACLAQDGEFGLAAGYGIYRNASVYSPAGKAAAGFRNRYVISALIGENLYDRIGGEVRYTYQDGDPFLSAGGVRTNIQGQSHAFHYDLLFYSRPREARIRLYAAVGAGAKLFVVSGPENPQPPLGEIARLRSKDEFKFLASFGGGVKWRVSRNVLFRIDFRDYLSPFPKKLIEPAPFGTGRGLFQQFTPMAGLSYTF
jgi:hypothetical protein